MLKIMLHTMAKMQRFGHLLVLILLLVTANACSGATFTLVNKCAYTVWPGILSGAGTPQLSTTGFSLQPGATSALSAPSTWSGRLWARTQCSTNSTTRKFSCLTADCGSGTIQCSGAGAIPPATLAEFTLGGSGGLDFYDVSLVDGYNLPLIVVPQGGRPGAGNCSATGCYVDVNGSCPAELRVTEDGGGSGAQSVACKSACGAFGAPKYCCSGAYASPSTCKPSAYSKFFKSACPSAYSYAYDDATSTFTCAGADYVITFCPTPAASKKATGQPLQAPEASPFPPGSPFYFIGSGASSSFTIISSTFTAMELLVSALLTSVLFLTPWI